jgi:hypothetical protein
MTSIMAKNRLGDDPVARLQEEARWSGFTNNWSRRVYGSRRAKRVILVYFGVLLAIGIVAAFLSLR